MAKRRTLKGGLAENMDIVEKAKQRALRARRLIPTQVEVSPGHWIFKMVEPSEVGAGEKAAATEDPKAFLNTAAKAGGRPESG